MPSAIEMWAAIPALIEQFENDPAVRSVVLHGAGDRAFVAGAAISPSLGKTATMRSRRQYTKPGILPLLRPFAIAPSLPLP